MTASHLPKLWLPLAGLLSLALGNPAQASLAIRNTPTKNVTCSAGVCTATAKSAVMNAGDLTSMLASSDVTLVSGSTAKDIESKVAFSWAGASRLTLDSYRSIAFDKLVTVAGTGALTLTTNDGGAGGTLSFMAPGRVAFWDLSSSLIVNGQSYTLVSDIATLAADIASDASGHYALANNCDATPDGTYAHSPIPTPLSGGFEGLGNAINKLRIQNKSVQEDLALFAAVTASGQISDVVLMHVVVIGGKTKSAGGLVAVNSGHLFGDSASGTIRQPGNGGASGELVGTNLGTISDSHGAGSVASDAYQGAAGGLVGLNASAIDHSDSSAAVTNSRIAYLGGLVGQSNGGTISDSFATGAVASSTYFATSGGLLGTSCCTAATTVSNSYATGAVSGSLAGGLIGLLQDSGDVVDHSHASGNISTANEGGGLVGHQLLGTNVSSSHATGNVNGFANGGLQRLGGLVGVGAGTIATSYASGSVVLNNGISGGESGGLVGTNQGSIDRSFATGTVTAETPPGDAGGLVGFNGQNSHGLQSTISNSYATGAASGASAGYVGGLAGTSRAHAYISTSYEIGAVSGGAEHGGFIGYNKVALGHDTNDYWDTTTSGQTDGVGHGATDGITGQTSTELQSGLPAGFDPAIWAQSPAINGGFPYLIDNPPPQ
jgi:hypothetical protein